MTVGKKVVVTLTALFLVSTLGTASPALELFDGELEMNGNNITSLNMLNGENVSDISYLGSTIDSSELSAESINSTNILDGSINSTDIRDGEVKGIDIGSAAIGNRTFNSSDAYTIDKLFLDTTLGATNLTLDSDDFATGETLDITSIDTGEIDAGAVDNSTLNSSDGYTVKFVSTNTALSDGNVSNALTVGTGGKITGAFVSTGTALQPGNLSLSDELSGDGTGSLEVAAGSITESGNELSAGAINSTAIKNGSVKGGDIAQEGATDGQVLEWNGNKWVPGTDDGGGTITNTSLDSTDDYTMNSLNTTGSVGIEVNSGDIEDGTNTIYDGANTEIPNGIVEGLANFNADEVFSGYPLGSSDIASGSIGGAELSNADAVNSSHISLGNGLTDSGSDGSIDVQSNDGTLTVLSGGIDVPTGGIGTVEIKQDGVNSSNLDMGNGLQDAGSDGSVDVETADTTLSVGTGGLDVASGGITGDELSTNSGGGVVNETHIESQVTTGALTGGAGTKLDLVTGGIDEASNYLAAKSVNATATRLGASGGLKDGGSGSIVVEAADIAGSYLSDDGSDNLQVDISSELAGDGSGNIEIAAGAVGGSELSNTGTPVNATHTDLGSNLTDLNSDGSIDVQDSFVVNKGDSMTGNLDMNANNNVTGVYTVEVNSTAVSQAENLPSCTSQNEGAITYNGTHHVGCGKGGDGTLAWETMY